MGEETQTRLTGIRGRSGTDKSGYDRVRSEWMGEWDGEGITALQLGMGRPLGPIMTKTNGLGGERLVCGGYKQSTQGSNRPARLRYGEAQ